MESMPFCSAESGALVDYKYPNLKEKGEKKMKKAVTAIMISMIVFSFLAMAPSMNASPTLEDDINTAIDNGLAWLHDSQETDGRWEYYWGDVGATSLAVLSYIHHYGSYDNLPIAYKDDVDDAISYILSKQNAVTGEFYDSQKTYETALGIMALNAMNDPQYNDEIAAARDWLINNQNDAANKYFGGWYYQEKYDYWSDLSNTHFAIMGLKVADDLVGGVPSSTWDDAETFVSRCQNDATLNPHYYTRDDGGGFVYMPSYYDTPDTGYSMRESSYGSMTGAGVWSLMLIQGIDTSDPRVSTGLNWLISNFSATENVGSEELPGDPDWYYYYYAWAVAKAFIICGVDPDATDPSNWYYQLASYLVYTKQVTDTTNPDFGSWVPASPWEYRVIATELALLVLEKSIGIEPPRALDKKVYVELLRNGDFSNGLTHWMVRVEKGASVQTYDGPTWLATRPLGPGWTDVNLVNEVGRTNVLDIVQTVSDGDGDWTGPYQILNRDVSGFSELYFEADGKAMFQSLAGDGWVGGEYPVHFIIQYEDVNGIQHDTWLGWPANPAWQQGFYYLAGNQPDEPYSNQVTQNVWFNYRSPNLVNLSPAPKMIKTVRLYSSGWAYHGRIDNAQLYGTPPSANLGDVIHVKLEVTVPSGETATVVDTLPSGLSYLTGTFTVDDVPATPTITKIGPPPSPPYHEISYTITESGTHLIEFDCKVDEAKSWTATEVCNVATVKWYDEAGELVETMEDVECFIIHAFEELDKNVGIPKKVKVIPAPVQFWREFIGGVTDIIVFDPPEITEPVALVREYAVLHEGQEPVPLELLTWPGTEGLPWEPIDTPEKPLILPPDGIAEYDIPTLESDTAVLVRYTVAWASSQNVIEAHFVNEAILESKSPQVIVGQLSNFDVHNDYHEPVDNFELELYGIDPADIVDWFPGWGAPPQINPIPGGTEIIWMEPTQPVQPCEWVHFGLHLKPGVIAEGIKAYWTQLDGGLVIKEKTNVQWRLEIEVTNPFPYTMTNVVITDRFGAEIEIDPPFPYSITHGTVSARAQGGSAKLFLTWNIGNLLPGETARLILLVSTDYNPGRGDCNEDNVVNILDAAYVSAHWTGLPAGPLGYDRNSDLNYDGNVDIFDAAVLSSVWGQSTTGHQEYTWPGIYELNSGATLKFIDPEQNMQLSAYTDSIYVTVLPEDDC